MERQVRERRRRLRALAAGTGALIIPAALAFAQPASAQDDGTVVYAADFEDGTVGDWVPRGPVTLAVEDGSLLTTGRSADWHGPSIDLTGLIAPGARYEIAVDVRFDADGDGEAISTTVQREADGETSYDSVVYQAAAGADWTRLSGEYSITSAADALTFYVESPTPEASYWIDDFQIVELAPPGVDPDIPSLKDVLADDFRIGAAVDPRDLADPSAQLLSKHFNQITAENHMKPDAIQPTEGEFTFDAADELVDYAEANGMEVYGHTFLWHTGQVPEWWFQYPEGHARAGEPLGSSDEDRQIMLDRLEAHIGALAEHYGDRIWAWDVVNEVISDNNAQVHRQSRWFEIFEGPEYVSHAFRIAREQFDAVGATDVKLFINDYGTENPGKRDNLYDLVAQMLADGVPVDGVGHQTHINLNTSIDQVEQSIDKFAELGVLQAVTELDVAIGAPAEGEDFPEYEDRLIEQGHYYRDLFAMYREHGDQLESVTVWGLHDGRSWLRSMSTPRPLESPLPFSDTLQAKWAYWGIVDPDRLPDLPDNEEPDYARVQVPLAETAPGIDGEKDAAWDEAATVATDVTVEGSAEGAKADVSLMWDDTALYALFEVTDPQLDESSPNPWEQDSVELFLNPGNTREGGYGEADGQYRVSFTNAVSVGGNGPEAGEITSAAAVTETGYRVEMAIALADEHTEIGAEHGLELQVNDGTDGVRTAVHTWYDPTGLSWNTNANWGIAELVEDVEDGNGGGGKLPTTGVGLTVAIAGAAALAVAGLATLILLRRRRTAANWGE
ncbi:endo-1,4-beta-xylanase [Glycomyces sp. TRM65418]|uniref:endo-1,4-beta-xylanase n=1 Tax=Glycomyces sp. TRM65418 TaxID=2867006 RepID=UPI001CE6D69E|nr:endo-1,4-beta-xylanase [Glycomyces sp. TRM65418]MCC3763455.1 endo-1,4-beta-xylanase [Glycomyces sp. TRM65418]QZD57444.1 endo-1,4-beta-xylanase [Glycomyces sp. TRM65418]